MSFGKISRKYAIPETFTRLFTISLRKLYYCMITTGKRGTFNRLIIDFILEFKSSSIDRIDVLSLFYFFISFYFRENNLFATNPSSLS